MRGTRRASRSRAALIAAMCFVLGLTACSSIPTSGPVGTLKAEDGRANADTPNYNVHGPSGNENPQAIVSGFLEAGLDSEDNYSVAREYLTTDLAQTWDATAGVLVTNGETTFADADGAQDSPNQRVTLAVERQIDANGIRTDEQRETSLNFSLDEVDGQWRISDAPDGLVLDRANFSNIVAPVTLWFYADSDYTALVPDVRWMVRRQGRVASVVSALMSGPAPYLRGAVTSAFPNGARLSRTSVPVEDGTATVDVPSSVVAAASEAQRGRMLQQLDSTLEQEEGVKDVDLTVNQSSVAPESMPNDVPVGETDGELVGVADDQLIRFKDGEVEQIKGADGLDQGLSGATMAPGQDAYAVLSSHRSSLQVLDSGGTVRTLVKGKQLADPSYDARSWVWTSSADQPGKLQVSKASGKERVELEPDWLAGDRVTGVRVSADGSRLALVVEREEDGKSNLYLLVAGIQRDDDGRPTGLAAPLDLGVTEADATEVVWEDEKSVVVYRADPEDRIQPQTSGLDLQHELWPPMLRLAALTATPGASRPAIAVNAAGTVYQRDDRNWREIGKGVQELSYRG
ncbi:LpqB family beta-propeller domain-containing protein [Galactobacter sp.]|uniref:LpqB family beta-propeller domain-containing protein n=1 Tax=Galactobacter sp. TaxID=2676125 RepID=UPI0025C57278|nr:LpqB family beta-propeller domain-containing protein [Galactobacter sp.]